MDDVLEGRALAMVVGLVWTMFLPVVAVAVCGSWPGLLKEVGVGMGIPRPGYRMVVDVRSN